jgi:hypothetical protein
MMVLGGKTVLERRARRREALSSAMARRASAQRSERARVLRSSAVGVEEGKRHGEDAASCLISQRCRRW